MRAAISDSPRCVRLYRQLQTCAVCAGRTGIAQAYFTASDALDHFRPRLELAKRLSQRMRAQCCSRAGSRKRGYRADARRAVCPLAPIAVKPHFSVENELKRSSNPGGHRGARNAALSLARRDPIPTSSAALLYLPTRAARGAHVLRSRP